MNGRKSDLKSEDLFVFSSVLIDLPSWLGYFLLHSLLQFSHIITWKDKKMLSSFSPQPVFGHGDSKLPKEASKRT